MYVNGVWHEDTRTAAEKARDAEASREGLRLFYRQRYGRELPIEHEEGAGPTAPEVATAYMRWQYPGPQGKR